MAPSGDALPLRPLLSSTDEGLALRAPARQQPVRRRGIMIQPHDVTGLTADAEEMVAARPQLVWDLVADVTRIGEWSQECIRAAWLGEPGRTLPGARFTGHNRLPNG